MDLKPIAHVRTCYGEKFSVPRQPGLVDEAWGEVVFEPEYRNADSLRGLENFSHVWLVFIFHQAIRDDWKPTIRPPRLGGNTKVGVFASRSPYRPNPIGLSCVRINHIDLEHEHAPVLRVSGIDLVGGTPLLDIKPYIPYSDSPDAATGGFANQAPARLNVIWDESVKNELAPQLATLIETTLSYDPRPAYHDDDREYGCVIENNNVRWYTQGDTIKVIGCEKL